MSTKFSNSGSGCGVAWYARDFNKHLLIESTRFFGKYTSGFSNAKSISR